MRPRHAAVRAEPLRPFATPHDYAAHRPPQEKRSIAPAPADGADAAGATVHLLPKARATFIGETTGPAPRVHRNAVVAAVLSRDFLTAGVRFF